VSDLDPKAHFAQYSTSVKLELPGLYVLISQSRSVVVTGASQVKTSQAWLRRLIPTIPPIGGTGLFSFPSPSNTIRTRILSLLWF